MVLSFDRKLRSITVAVFVLWNKLKAIQLLMGGCRGLCSIGTRHLSFARFLCCFVIFQALETFFYLSMHHIARAFMHENYKANKTRPKKEAEDASSIVNVEA
ncbi:unnamed protein product [Ilex paraguariensis]|uniref:Uncharacterized protein n=1 Tax=Ilex paraguariensis TaxID=185542 RepID=A0ABC8UDP7_9AQUA